MATIEIKNVGPVKEAKFDLNKVNVFMGPQSSGKSTIAKIISYCTWVEKRRMLDGFFRENFLERLKSFHNLEDTYFPEGSYFRYEGDYCNIEFLKNTKPKEKIEIKNDTEFANRKQIYIPAERNFVASIPNLGRYKETNNNILDFLYYWYEAKKIYSNVRVLNIPELNVKFRHENANDKDVVVFEDKKEISLQSASSGVQSMLPLYLLIDYLTRIIYGNATILSPLEQEKTKERAISIYGSNVEEYRTKLYEISLRKNDKSLREFADRVTEKQWEEMVQRQFKDEYSKQSYTHSQFTIEEPEQNLFPTTQRDLIYYMMRVLNESNRYHRLTFTTHSPYILYALNNCMMGSLVYDKMSDNDKGRLKCGKALINPEKVSIYQIEDGVLRRIQEEDGLIGSNYFDDKMKELMDDFYVMLNYYGK